MNEPFLSPEEFMEQFRQRVNARPPKQIKERKFEVTQQEVKFDAHIPKREYLHRPANPPPPYMFPPDCACGEPSLEFRNRGASKAKCGYSEFPGFVSSPPKRYLRADTVWDATEILIEDCEGFGSSAVQKWVFSGTCYRFYDPVTCSVSSGGGWQRTNTTCGGESTTDPQICPELPVCSEYQSATECDFDRGATTLSDEHTTAMLLANTLGALPAWTEEEWGEPSVGSFASLSVSELNYSAREEQVRILHQGSCYLKVWLRTAFYPATGGDPEYDDLDIYEYTAGAEGDHESSPYTIPIPTENGTTYVESKHICREGDPEPAWPS